MRILLALFAILTLATTAEAAEVPGFAGRTALIMVDDIGCIYCEKWDREVGVGYPKSDEGRFAPLVKIHLADARRQGIKALAYTPTFILVVDGEERGRITGYAGADFFWGELEQLIKRGGLKSSDIRASLRPWLA